MPRDFEELWPTLGWGAAKEHYGAHTDMIGRWLDQCGRDRMILARQRFKEAQQAIRDRSRRKRYRYVLGIR